MSDFDDLIIHRDNIWNEASLLRDKLVLYLESRNLKYVGFDKESPAEYVASLSLTDLTSFVFQLEKFRQ